MLGVHPGIKQGAYFLPTQDGGEFAPFLGLGHFLVKPGLLEDGGVKKLERGEAQANGEPGQLALVEQLQLVMADVFRPQLVG